MADNILTPTATRPILNEDLTATVEHSLWMQKVTDRSSIVGSGSPEGVVSAEQGASYIDETGISGAVFFVKQLSDILGDKTKGWYQVG